MVRSETASAAARAAPAPYLSHEPVGTGVLFILEYDVSVIIGSQLFKSLGVSGDLAFVSAARPQGLLRHVGDELFVRKRCQLLRVSSPAVAPARPASHSRGHKGQAEETDQYDSGPKQHVFVREDRKRAAAAVATVCLSRLS